MTPSRPSDVPVALDAVAWPVRTSRLTIRPPRADDYEATWRYRRLEAVTSWITAHLATLDEHAEWFSDPDSLAKSLVVELDGDIIGDLMLKVQDGWSQAEVAETAHDVQADLGWCFDPSFQGQGYATEAVRAVLRICFEDLGLRRVTADCFAANEPSWRLMERLGMRREVHAVRESLHRSGEWMDSYGYALLADEWREQDR